MGGDAEVWGDLSEGSYRLKVPRPLKRLTTLEFCCRTRVPTQLASRKASDLDQAGYPDSSN